jgi:hypothetical protein
MKAAQTSRSPSRSPEEVRGALRALAEETPPGEREFTARLHRRLAAAGPPPAETWLARLVASFRDPWRDVQRRALLTGALVGALVTATLFTLVAGAGSGPQPHTGVTSSRLAPTMRYFDRPNLHADRKSPRTLGDRRSARDRLGADFAADRPERAHARVTH